MTNAQKKKIYRLKRAGCDNATIAAAMQMSRRTIGTYLMNERIRREKARQVNSIGALVTVKNPEAYLKAKGVWYGDDMSMVRSA